MKSVTVVSLAALAALGAAQEGSLSSCGQMCLDNMQNLFKELGCASRDDIACLCKSQDYTHGLRDCTVEACEGENADAVVAAGQKLCEEAGGSAPSSGSESSGSEGASKTGDATSGGSNPTNSATPTGDDSKSDASSTPYTTEPIVSTITSGSDAPITTTVGSTTLYTVPGSSGASGPSDSDSDSSPSASPTPSDSDSSPTPSDSESAPTDSASGTNSPDGNSNEPSSSAPGGEPSPTDNVAPTMGPVGHGVAGALGLAALLAL